MRVPSGAGQARPQVRLAAEAGLLQHPLRAHVRRQGARDEAGDAGLGERPERQQLGRPGGEAAPAERRQHAVADHRLAGGRLLVVEPDVAGRRAGGGVGDDQVGAGRRPASAPPPAAHRRRISAASGSSGGTLVADTSGSAAQLGLEGDVVRPERAQRHHAVGQLAAGQVGQQPRRPARRSRRPAGRRPPGRRSRRRGRAAPPRRTPSRW